ncbi:MAG: hypothetical protein ABH950_03220 [Candidatus Altiarchaeota archaeon]
MNMEVKVIEKKKDLLEIEFEDKIMAEALLSELMKKGVDAYTHEKHPLLPGYRLRIEAKDAQIALKTAISDLEKDWKSFKGAVEKAVK